MHAVAHRCCTNTSSESGSGEEEKIPTSTGDSNPIQHRASLFCQRLYALSQPGLSALHVAKALALGKKKELNVQKEKEKKKE